MQGIRAGSLELRDYLSKLDEAQDVQDEKRTGRKTAMELALLKAQGDNSIATQRVANEGGVNVATVNNTGAMDRVITTNKNAVDMQKTLLDAEAPVRTAQAKSLDAGARFSSANAKALEQEEPFRPRMFESKAKFGETQAANAGLNYDLNKAYGAKRIESEIKAQDAGVAKLGMELDYLNRDYDKQNADAAMQSAINYYNHPTNVAHRQMEDFTAEKAAQAQMAPSPLTSSRGQLNEYSESILGKPSTLYSVLEKVPVLGAIPRVMRANQAAETARRKASGIATPS